MKTALYNGIVITPGEMIMGGIVMEDGRITAIFAGQDAPQADDLVDCGGRYIAPGFVDVHIHGCYGGGTMDATPEGLHALTRMSAKHGTTALLPSTFSASHEAVYAAAENVAQAMKMPPQGARILGAHLEGNYFAPVMAGAQNPAYLYPPAKDDYMDFVKTGVIRRVAAAPELEGALEMGERLRALGIQVSIGHSNGRFADVTRAVAAGYTSITHIYNAESTINSVFLAPDAGVCEGALTYDEMFVECICDGHHLSPDLLRFIYKVKGAGRMMAVTDSVYAGAPDGELEVGGLPVVVRDGACYLQNGKALAGSMATMDRCARTLYHKAGIQLADVVKICASTPAALIGEDGHIGSLAPGYDADVVVFDEDINVSQTYVLGKPFL